MNTDNYTRITLTVDNTVITAVLNNSKSSQELIKRLPCSISLNRYEHDFCGIIAPPLPYNDTDLQNGWKNGDIAFAADGSYFAILYKDEEISQQFGNLVTMGKITCDPLFMDTLNSNITIKIELA